MRTEDRVIPDLLCGRDEHLVRDTEAPELRGRQAPPPRTVRPALPMQLLGLASLAGPAARVATGRSRPAHTGVSPVLSPARLCRPPGVDAGLPGGLGFQGAKRLVDGEDREHFLADQLG
jgi:hypothetical protein